jgi:glycerophosphoryl diester phosphodiesterase
MKNSSFIRRFNYSRIIPIGLIFITLIHSCDFKNNQEASIDGKKSIQVIAHRGDWLQHPENSINSIESCISMGIDVVEIDVRETKDDQLVLMHDETIDRTTNGTGRIEDWNLKELKTLFLKDKTGKLTLEKIPTLQEALETSKNRIVLKLDKTYRCFQLTYDIVSAANQIDQVLFKTHVPNSESSKIIPAAYDIKLIPMLEFPMDSPEQFVKGHMKNPQVIGFEFILPHDDIPFIENFQELNLKGKEIWVNSFWATFNGGHDDNKFEDDPGVYEWYIDNHVTMIQTDHPERLLNYLRSKGLHK